jgi:hypothetical protein
MRAAAVVIVPVFDANWVLSSGELPPDTSRVPSFRNEAALQKLLTCCALKVVRSSKSG